MIKRKRLIIYSLLIYFVFGRHYWVRANTKLKPPELSFNMFLLYLFCKYKE